MGLGHTSPTLTTPHAPPPPAVSRPRRKKPRLLRVDQASTVCPDLPPSSTLSPSIRALEHTKHRLPQASDLLFPLGPTCGINMVGETQPAQAHQGGSENVPSL